MRSASALLAAVLSARAVAACAAFSTTSVVRQSRGRRILPLHLQSSNHNNNEKNENRGVNERLLTGGVFAPFEQRPVVNRAAADEGGRSSGMVDGNKAGLLSAVAPTLIFPLLAVAAFALVNPSLAVAGASLVCNTVAGYCAILVGATVLSGIADAIVGNDVVQESGAGLQS